MLCVVLCVMLHVIVWVCDAVMWCWVMMLCGDVVCDGGLGGGEGSVVVR